MFRILEGRMEEPSYIEKKIHNYIGLIYTERERKKERGKSCETPEAILPIKYWCISHIPYIMGNISYIPVTRKSSLIIQLETMFLAVCMSLHMNSPFNLHKTTTQCIVLHSYHKRYALYGLSHVVKLEWPKLIFSYIMPFSFWATHRPTIVKSLC